MQLNGNDFIFVNSLESKIRIYENFVREVCDRNFGVGADGLVLLLLSDKADCRIEIYNSDGSKAQICGNALLSLGRYLFGMEDFELQKLGLKNKLKNRMSKLIDIYVETDAGIKKINCDMEYDEIKFLLVNMGKIDFEKLCLKEEQHKEVGRIDLKKIDKDDICVSVDLLSVGNLHMTIVVNDISKIDNRYISDNKYIVELNKVYNIEFMQVIDRQSIKVKIFEKGVGETLSCGSGACACALAAVKNQICDKDKKINVISKGGKHQVEFTDNSDMILYGNPTLVYNGCLKI